MKLSELREQVAFELTAVEETLDELTRIRTDAASSPLSTRDIAAASLFLANFYNGIEGILMRVAKRHGVEPPSGDSWHADLADMFTEPATPPLPSLFDERLARELAPFRRFRHVVHHGYGIRIQWRDMLPGVRTAADMYSRFLVRLGSYLGSGEDQLGSDA